MLIIMIPKLALATVLAAWLSLADVCIEKMQTLPPGWTKNGDKVDPNEQYSFSIALKQPGVKRLQSVLTSARNRTLSRDDVIKMRTPPADSVARVEAWLSRHGINDFHTKNGWIKVQATVQQTNALIRTRLERYTHEGDNTPVLRSTQYFVPDSIKADMDFIHPIANFMRPSRTIASIRRLNGSDVDMVKRGALQSPCESLVTPGCVKQIYNMNYATPDQTSNVILGVTGFLEEYANYADSDKFLREQAPDLYAKGYNYTVEPVNGGLDVQDMDKSGREAALDVDYTLGLASPVKLVYYSAGGRGQTIDEDGQYNGSSATTNEPFVETFQYLLDKPEGELPSVLSVSYSDDEVSVPQAYAEKVCEMIGMLASRGMTILVGSGDGGARGGRDSNCRTRDGTGKKITVATFPSTCPWVLAVGAVVNSGGPPKGADFSTGGFSQYFEQQAFQLDMVHAYVDGLDGHLDGYFDRGMRAIPDLAAVGTDMLVVSRGEPTVMAGTSASTPIVASMLALVNDARARAGKKSLGWANPLLYSEAVRATMVDVTEGTSKSCDWDGVEPGGWPAKPGWDAITGLGVPGDFSKFLDALVHADD